MDKRNGQEDGIVIESLKKDSAIDNDAIDMKDPGLDSFAVHFFFQTFDEYAIYRWAKFSDHSI